MYKTDNNNVNYLVYMTMDIVNRIVYNAAIANHRTTPAKLKVRDGSPQQLNNQTEYPRNGEVTHSAHQVPYKAVAAGTG